MGDSEWSCCNAPQKSFCAVYIFYAFLVLCSWKTSIAKPMRLVSVFLHEISHAIACWITGGNVVAIEVYNNEGGVTKYIGGCRCLIIPAGYVGCSMWAMVFVVMSGGRKTATLAASLFTFFLLVSLCYSPNKVMVRLNLSYAVITLAFIFVEWYFFTPVLMFVTLFYGVFIGLYSVVDIYDDLITRTVEGSDAHACHRLCPCCFPRCVGVQWALCALFFQMFGIWFALALMSDECQDRGWFECVHSYIDFDNFDRFWDGHR